MAHSFAHPDALRCLALVHRDLGRYDKALDLAEAALTMAQAMGYRRVKALAVNTLATVQYRLGWHNQAIENHRAAIRLAREIMSRMR